MYHYICMYMYIYIYSDIYIYIFALIMVFTDSRGSLDCDHDCVCMCSFIGMRVLTFSRLLTLVHSTRARKLLLEFQRSLVSLIQGVSMKSRHTQLS